VTRAVIGTLMVVSSLAAPGPASAGVLGGAARAPGRPAGRGVVSRRGVMIRPIITGHAPGAPPRHRRTAVPPVRPRGTAAARAPAPIGSRSGRRPAVVAGSGERPGVVGRYGDAAMGFVRRNAGPLAAATVLAAFVSDPGPFLDGAGRLVAGAARSAAVLPGAIGRSTAWAGWWGAAQAVLVLVVLRLAVTCRRARGHR
jgi:hypothetical protein